MCLLAYVKCDSQPSLCSNASDLYQTDRPVCQSMRSGSSWLLELFRAPPLLAPRMSNATPNNCNNIPTTWYLLLLPACPSASKYLGIPTTCCTYPASGYIHDTKVVQVRSSPLWACAVTALRLPGDTERATARGRVASRLLLACKLLRQCFTTGCKPTLPRLRSNLLCHPSAQFVKVTREPRGSYGI